MASTRDEVLAEHTPLLNPTFATEDVNNEKSVPVRSLRFWLLLASYSSIVFLSAANATGLAPALGHIAYDLHAYQDAATWFNASYMIASSCTNPSIGRLATIFSPVYLFLSCTAAFTVGSVISGFAQNSTTFCVGRAITGCGAGGIFTTATVLLVDAAPVKRRGLLVGLVNSLITTGSSLGGVISGAFATSRWGWRPAFIFQAPICLLASLCILVVSPPSQPKLHQLSLRQKFAQIDYLGIATLSIALVFLLMAAMAETFTILPIIIGCISLVTFVLVEYRFADLPMIPMPVLLHSSTFLGCLATMCTMAARWTVLFYAPIWSIAVLGYHPASAGASLIPTSFGFATGGLVVGAAFVRHGGAYYWQSILSILALMSSYLIFNALSLPSSLPIYLSLLVFNGVATGATLNFTLGHILSTTSEKAIVTGLYATFRGLAPSAGAGLAGGVLQRTLDSSLRRLFRSSQRGGKLGEADLQLIHRLKGSPNLVWQLEGWQRQAGILAYEEAIKSVFWLAVGAAATGLLLQAFTRFGSGPSKEDKQIEQDQASD